MPSLQYSNLSHCVAGLVLGGGRSRRMGTEKGLLPIYKTNWILHAKEKMEHLVSPVLLSLQKRQLGQYQPFLSNPFILDSVKIQGPLAGILTAHLHYPHCSFLVLACDNILVDLAILKRLVNEFQKQPDCSGVLFQSDNQIEPLIGLYSQKWLDLQFQKYLQNGSLSFRIKDHLDLDQFVLLSASDEEKFKLKNFNSLQDWEDWTNNAPVKEFNQNRSRIE